MTIAMLLANTVKSAERVAGLGARARDAHRLRGERMNPYLRRAWSATPRTTRRSRPCRSSPRPPTSIPERVAVIHGDVRRNWREIYARCRRLASALQKRGVKRGDTVAAMLPNVPAMIELHFGAGDVRRGAEHAQHAARRRGDRLHARPRRGEGRCSPIASSPPIVEGGARAREGEAARDRRGRRALRGRRARRARSSTRRFLAEGDAGLRVECAARRVGRHRAQLHLGHHRQSRRAWSTTIAART